MASTNVPPSSTRLLLKETEAQGNLEEYGNALRLRCVMQLARRPERRRTVRVPLRVSLMVEGQAVDGDEFRRRSHTESVSAYGALIHLDVPVVVGQKLMLINEATQETVECRIVSLRHSREGRLCAGVEIIAGDTNFWHMVFPKAGTRQATRGSRTGELVLA